MLDALTRIKTKQGWQTIASRLTEHNLFTVDEYGLYTFCLARGNSTKLWTVKASRPQQWPLVSGKTTYDLRIGDVVSAVDEDSGYNRLGWLHGFLKRQGFGGVWYSLVGDYVKKFKGRLDEQAVEKRQEKGEWQYRFPNVKWSDLPNQFDDFWGSEYLGSFIRGFMDGAKSNEQVATTDLATAEWIQLYAPFGGYVPSGEITRSLKTNKASIPAKSTFHEVFTFQMVRGDLHGGFRVRDARVIREPLLVSHWPTVEKMCLEGGIQVFS